MTRAKGRVAGGGVTVAGGGVTVAGDGPVGAGDGPVGAGDGPVGAGDGVASAGEVRAERSTVQSVDRTLALFKLLVNAPEDMGVRELGEAADLPAGTVHRLLGVLQHQGLVRQDAATRRYTVGFAAMDLASKIASRGGLRLRAQPILRDLVRQVGETANLAVRDGGEAVYVASEAAQRMTRSFTEIGNRVPLHATGIGKVLLAWLQGEQRDALARRIDLRQFTPTTITDSERLLAELAAVRLQGYARDEGELEEGVRCIAVPVRDQSTHVVAALSVSGPSSRLTEERLVTVVDQVRAAGETLSDALGYRRVQAAEPPLDR